MAKIVGRRSIELKISDQINGYIPVYNSSSRLWSTISKNDFITGSAITSGSNSFVGDQTVSGSLYVVNSITSAGGFTGSLFGTASHANNAWAIGGNTFNISGSGQEKILGTLSNDNLNIYVSSSRVAVFNTSGSFILGSGVPDPTTTAKLFIDASATTSYDLIKAISNVNHYSQLNIQNFSSGVSASSDIIATADNGNESVNYIDMGINSSTFTGSVGDANDAYLYSTGNDLHIGNASNYPVQLFAGGANVNTNRKLLLNPNNLHQMTGSLNVSSNVVASSFTGSLQGTASVAVSSSYAATSSYANNFTVAGTLTAQTIVAQTITSSTEFITGSTKNGSLLSNTHQFTGSVSVTGSLEVNGSNTVLTNQTGSMSVATASYVLQAQSASFALTASYLLGQSPTASYALTASFVPLAQTASYVLNAVSSSFASTASSVNRLNQNVVISGSLTVTGSTNIIGDSGATLFSSNADTLILTGSLLTSGSIILTGSLSILGSATGSLLGTASYATQALTASNANTASFVQIAQTASYVLNAVSSSFAATASSADDFTVRGTLTAQKIVAQTITSSTEFITGSTKFGSLLTDTHQFTGSVGITGSLTVNAPLTINNSNTTNGIAFGLQNWQINSSGGLITYNGGVGYDFRSNISNTNFRFTFGPTVVMQINSSSHAVMLQSAGTFNDNGYRLQIQPAVSGSLFVSGSSLFSGSVRSTNGFTGSFSGSLYNLQNSIVGHIPFFSSSQVLADSIATQLDNGSGSYSIAINQNNITTAAPEALYVYQPSATSYNVIAGKGNLNNYLQLNIQNTNTGVSASSDVVATANNGNESVNFIDMGINSEGFTGLVGDANDAYLYSTGNDLHIGNASNFPIQFFAGGLDTNANKKFQLNPNNSHQMTGSLDVSGSVVARSFTGSLQGTASVAVSASYAISASYAVTASLAINANNAINASTASYVLQAQSASYWSGSIINAATASYVLNAQSASYWSGSIINAATASYVLNAQTASYVLQAISASFATSASYWSGSIINAATASYALNAVSASYAASASFIAGISDGTASLAISASYAATASSADNFLVRGTLTAQTINVQTITSSIDFVTGSSRFGSTTDNTHQFTGSVSISGSLAVNNSPVILTNQTSSMSVSTASYSANADLLDGKDSTTFATTGSNIFVGSQTISGSLLISGSVSTIYNSYEIHVNGVDGNDTTGDGTLLNPVKTITQALTLISAARLTIILHPGTYSESPTINATNTTIFATGLNGANTFINGTLTINAAARISGVKITNLVLNTSASVYVTSCVVDTSLTKSGSGYAEFTLGEYQCTSGINISGAGSVTFIGVKLYFINVNNSSASVILKGCTQILSPTVTSGSLAISDSVVVALTATGSAITTYPNSVITLANSYVLVPTGDNVARVSFSGFYSVLNAVYDKNNSTLASLSATGGSLSAISFFQDINLQSTTITGSLNITGSTVQKGNNTLSGNTVISGSLTVSGSTPGGGSNINIYGDTSVNGAIKFLPVSETIDTSVSASYIFVSGSTQDLYFSQNSKGFSNVTRLRWLEGNLYTGLLNGGLITTQSSTIYNISSGSGIIVDLNASLSDDPYPVIQYVEWNNLSASIAPSTGSYDQAFVGVDNTSNIFAQGTPFISPQFDTLIPIGVVLHQNRSTINGVKTQPSVAYGAKQRQNIFTQAFGPLKLSGLTINPSGSSTGSLIVTSGTAYADGANYSTDASNPSYITDPGTTVSKIFRYRQSGSGWVYDTNGGAGYGAVNPSQYSNNGTLASVANGEYSIQRVFWFPNSATKAIVVYYGNTKYATEAEATLNINIESFAEAPNTEANAVYLGALILAGDADFTNAASYGIIPGGLFRGVSGAGGGGSTITTALSGLSDVTITGPTNGQPLVYNTTAGKWVNQSTLTATLTGNASTATSASYAATASSSDNFTVRGTLTAQTIVAQTITSSIEFITGSTRNGSLLTNTHQFTGSVLMTGSLDIAGNISTKNTNQVYNIGEANADYNTVWTGTVRGTGGLILRGGDGVEMWGAGRTAIKANPTTNTVTIQNKGTYTDNGYNLQINGSGSASGSLFVSGSSLFNGTATIKSASLDYQQNLAVATGSFQTIVSAATGSFRSAFFDYVAFSGSIVRAGTVVSTWSGSNTEFYENFTGDLGGSTAVVTLQTAISASNIVLQAGISGSAWSVRSLVRLL